MLTTNVEFLKFAGPGGKLYDNDLHLWQQGSNTYKAEKKRKKIGYTNGKIKEYGF